MLAPAQALRRSARKAELARGRRHWQLVYWRRHLHWPNQWFFISGTALLKLIALAAGVSYVECHDCHATQK